MRYVDDVEGVKGSWESSGKLVFVGWADGEVGFWKVMDLMNMTWHVSGCRELSVSLFVHAKGRKAGSPPCC